MRSKLVRNLGQALARPALAFDYIHYGSQKLVTGAPIRRLFGDLVIEGFNGFSEWHSCARAVNEIEYIWLTEWPLAEGAIIDVGANRGIVSLILAKRFPSKTIHAFEPHPETYKALLRNAKRNSWHNVTCNPAALGRVCDSIAFCAHAHARANSRIAQETDDVVIEVPCMTIDEYTAEARVGPVSLLKFDVEGFEMLVFEGATDLLTHGQIGAIYYEVCPELTERMGFEPEAPSTILQRSGYKLYRLNERAELEPARLSSLKNITLENWVALRR